MISDSAQQFESLCQEIEHRDDREFAASLFTFLSHLQNDSWCRAAATDLHLEEQASVDAFTEEARQIALAVGDEYTAIKAIRVPPFVSPGSRERVDSMSSVGNEGLSDPDGDLAPDDNADEYDPLNLEQCKVLLEQGDDAILLSPGTPPLVHSRTRRCLQALRSATDRMESDKSNDIDERVALLETRYENAWRKRHIDALVSSGAALARMEDALGILGKTSPRTSALEGARQVGRLRNGLAEIERLVFGVSDHPSNRNADNNLTNHLRRLRADFRLAWIGIRSRLTGTLSLHNAMNRYKLRCQAYDATALRRLVQDSARPEDRLVEHVARFLFDQGLAPLLWPQFANLEADILQPPSGENRWSVYIEAKQYVNTNTRYIRQGFWEMEDHLVRLSGSPYAPREGFYVIFRRGGAQYRCPAVVTVSNISVYPIVIDIAEPDVSGSRQAAAPIALTVADLQNRVTD